MTNEESLILDTEKVIIMLKKSYDLDNVVILTRKGDQLGTFTAEDNEDVPKRIIEIAHKFHNEGQTTFVKEKKTMKTKTIDVAVS